MTDVIELVELAAYVALKLKNSGKTDQEVMAQIKAMKESAPDTQTLLDNLLQFSGKLEAEIDAKLNPPT